MKHIAFAALFVASLAAQNPVVKTEPDLFESARSIKLELASAIAVEEQEKDLVKAQGLFRAAMDDQKLSVEARAYARSRLVALLRRLGNDQEAKAVLKAGGKGVVVSLDDVTNGLVNGQDPEREKELRLQARELLKKSSANDTGTRALGQKLTEQLNWIGTPAVAEVVLHLQQQMATGNHPGYEDELFRFLWQQGGPRAATCLVTASQSEKMSVTAAQAARVRKEIDIQSPEARAFLDHESWEITSRFLSGIHASLDAAELLTLADRGGIDMKVYVLGMLRQRTLDAKQRQRAHAMCRAAVGGTSPDYGKAAESFLTSSASQQSLEGMQMLLDLVPDLHARDVSVASFHLQGVNGMILRKFSKAEVEALLPAMRAVVEKIGPIENSSRASSWMVQLMHVFMQSGGESTSQLAIGMWDMGYEMHAVFHGQSSPSVAKKLLQRWRKVPNNARRSFLRGFDNVELPSDTLPLLREIANEVSGDDRDHKTVVNMVGQTGHDGAADWLVAEWRKHLGSNGRSSKYRPLVWAMLTVGKKNQSEHVRTAMSNMVRGIGGPTLSLEDRSQLLLAMLSMGDEQALDLVAVGTSARAVHHPYGGNEVARDVSPLSYLMHKNPKPAHGYSRKQILDTVTRYAQRISRKGGLDPAGMSLWSIPDDVLAVLATEELSGYPICWSQKLVRRLNSRIAKGEDFAVLEKCYLSALGKPNLSARWVAAPTMALVAQYRKQITAVIDGPDGDWAIQAVHMLQYQGDALDVAALLRNKHFQVRMWAADRVLDGEAKVPPATLVPLLGDANANVRESVAKYLGAIVYKQAVPGLIEQLRDTDPSVRTVAADALTRIRFYHEQQAHWDRVLKGLDASPASAAEKLLVQAKPDANKQQRLLAIKSLGVLGAPEALPFLIDWTQDADKDIGDAAKAAITKIHLSPRK